MILVFVIAFLALALVVRLMAPPVRRMWRARQLRGDWWIALRAGVPGVLEPLQPGRA